MPKGVYMRRKRGRVGNNDVLKQLETISQRPSVIEPSPERWEYMETKEPLPVRNRYGELGWKLVAATEDSYGKVTFHFCRRIRP